MKMLALPQIGQCRGMDLHPRHADHTGKGGRMPIARLWRGVSNQHRGSFQSLL